MCDYKGSRALIWNRFRPICTWWKARFVREIGEESGVPAYLLLGPDELDPAWIAGTGAVGVTSGASTPEVSVTSVVDRLRELGATDVEEVAGVDETILFTLPVEVR